MSRMKIIATLVAAALTSTSVFAHIDLPNPPKDSGTVIDAQHVNPFDIVRLQQQADAIDTAGIHTLLTIKGDSGGPSHDVSFLNGPDSGSLNLHHAGFILDLVQHDDVQLASNANSPNDRLHLTQDADGSAIYYVKNNAGTLTNNGYFNLDAKELPKDKHLTGKIFTQRIERNNLTLRT